jgi:hypothetical protein
MRHILLAAAVLAASPASAGQMLVPTARGPVYAPAYRYSGPPPGYGQGFLNYRSRGYVPPGYLGGYLPPVGPRYYDRRGDVGGAIA